MSDLTLAHVARLFYERELTKQEIARRLGISRFRVARLLERARAEGIVRVEIREPVPTADPLGRALEERFGLDVAVVVAEEALGPAAAGLLPALLDDRTVLGVAWGATLADLASALDPFERRIDVVQICGAVPGLEPGTGPTEVVLRIGERTGGAVLTLPVPAVSSPAARDELLCHPAVRPTVERFDDVTLAVVGIGTHPVGGHVLLHAFDRDGTFAETELTGGGIALDLAPPRHARVLAVAGGAPKRDAVRGALRAGLVDLLVTDPSCAEAALA